MSVSKPKVSANETHIPPLLLRGSSALLAVAFCVFAIDNAFVSQPIRPVIGAAYAILALVLFVYAIFGIGVFRTRTDVGG